MELKQTANEAEKMFNILAIKEMQIDTTLRYHFIGTRLLGPKSQITPSIGEDEEKLEA